MNRRIAEVLAYGLSHSQLALTAQQHKVLNHILACGTQAMGEVLFRCQQCGFESRQPASCRDRHCPQCQYHATQQWCSARAKDVLPVRYFHLVFTLPSELNGWVACHSAVLYRLLFESVWQTLQVFGQDPKRLNGQLGMISVLHTWGQTLTRHVHLHCLLPGGALSEQGDWQAARSNYLFPVKALSRQFRGRMVSALRGAYQKGLLAQLSGEQVDTVLTQLMQKNWVVYSKPALYGSEKLIDYLGRYTRRIALTPNRLQGFDGEHVRLRYHDYRDNRAKSMILSATELLRRFVQHILPKGFMRVRHYGFLANSVRRVRLRQIRDAIACEEKPATKEMSQSTSCCPQCGQQQWQIVRLNYFSYRMHWRPG